MSISTHCCPEELLLSLPSLILKKDLGVNFNELEANKLYVYQSDKTLAYVFDDCAKRPDS